MPKVPLTSAAIEAELERYLALPTTESPSERAGAEYHRVLPLLSDFMGCWALAPSGWLVFFGWDDPEALDTVADSAADVLGTHVALAIGSRRYPALAAMRPQRSPDSVTCTQCDGAGGMPGVPSNILCACGGLGWLPPSIGGAA